MMFICYRNILALLLAVALMLTMYYLFLKPSPASDRDAVKIAAAGDGDNEGKTTDSFGEETGLGAPVTMKALGMGPHISGLALVGGATGDAAVCTASAGAGAGAGAGVDTAGVPLSAAARKVPIAGALSRVDLGPSTPSSDLSNSLVLAEESKTESITDTAPGSLGRAGLEKKSSASPVSLSPVVVPFIC